MSDNIKPFNFGTDRHLALAFAFEYWIYVENVKVENNNWTIFISKPEIVSNTNESKIVVADSIKQKQDEVIKTNKPKRNRVVEKAKRTAKENLQNKAPKKAKPQAEVEDSSKQEDLSEPESVEDSVFDENINEAVKSNRSYKDRNKIKIPTLKRFGNLPEKLLIRS